MPLSRAMITSTTAAMLGLFQSQEAAATEDCPTDPATGLATPVEQQTFDASSVSYRFFRTVGYTDNGSYGSAGSVMEFMQNCAKRAGLTVAEVTSDLVNVTFNTADPVTYRFSNERHDDCDDSLPTAIIARQNGVPLPVDTGHQEFEDCLVRPNPDNGFWLIIIAFAAIVVAPILLGFLAAGLNSLRGSACRGVSSDGYKELDGEDVVELSGISPESDAAPVESGNDGRHVTFSLQVEVFGDIDEDCQNSAGDPGVSGNLDYSKSSETPDPDLNWEYSKFHPSP